MIRKSNISYGLKFSPSLNLSLVVLFLIVALMPLTVYLVTQQQDIRQRAQTEGAEFVVSPNISQANPGQNLALAININTKSNPVSAVQVNITYPSDKLTIEKVDTSKSSFNIPNEYIAGSGLIKIGREVQTPVVGEQHVATIVFNAKQEVSSQDIKIVPGSTILRASDKTNIYAGDVKENQQSGKASNFGDQLLNANSHFWDFIYTKLFPSVFTVFKER